VIVSPGAAEWLSGGDPTNPAAFDRVHQNGARM
jgi:hypothetical protein